jgi:hypothetical protein
MLMDLFFKSLPSTIKRKRRVHFHAFMIDVHKRLHAAKIAMGYEGGDPIAPVARDLAKEAYVLCFDEFQVRASRPVPVVSPAQRSHGWIYIGDRYRGRYDPEATIGVPLELWCCLCLYVEVSLVFGRV